MDLRTKREIERDKRNEGIIARCLEIKAEHPEASSYRIFGVVAEECKMTKQSVANIVKKSIAYDTICTAS